MNTLTSNQKIKTESKEDELLFSKILSFNLTREKAYLAKTEGLSQSHLDEMEIEYKKYLFISCKHPNVTLPISENVDDLWHSHVLDTRSYDKFCSEIAGRKIHHSPTVDNSENYELMPAYQNNTLVLYAKYFGAPTEKFWINITPEGACCTH